MPILEWDDKFSVNVKEIDMQHKQIISILYDMHNLRVQKDPQKIQKVIDDLLDYVRYHFSTEEKYLSENSYPDIQKHKSEHAKFIVQVYEFQENYLENKSLPVENLFNFVWDWFNDHILVTDKKYKVYFEQNNPNDKPETSIPWPPADWCKINKAILTNLAYSYK